MDDGKAHPSELLEFQTALSSLPDPPQQSHSNSKEKYPNQTTISTTTTNATDFHGKYEDIESAHNIRRMSVSGLSIPSIGQDAFQAAQSEHRMTFLQGLKLYPKAIFWSAIISMAIVMEGYDTALINSFYAFPEFQRSYGVPVGDGQYQITARWQTTLSNGAAAGSIIGLLANGPLTERFGYRRTMMGALIFLSCCIFLSFFAFNIQTLLAGQILCGLPWGVFSTLTTTYAAEVMPLTLRGYLTANVNLCWLIGQVTALAILRGFLQTNTEWSYRVPFGMQWMWVVIIFTAAFFAPESPWYLVRKQRIAEAREVLTRLTMNGPDFNVDNTIAMMQHTDVVEKKLGGGHGKRNDLSYLECFRGTNRRRTEIACMIFLIQNLCGLPVISFSAYFFQRIGFDDKISFDIVMGMHGLAICGSLLCIVLLKSFGRRTLYLCGLGVIFVILLVGGIIGTLPETPRTLWALAAMIITFIFVFDVTAGPVTYTIIAEIPSTRLRINTVVLARISYNLCALVTNVLSSHMLSPLAWDWRGKSCFFWAGTCALCFVYCFFRLPETKGLTYHELDILFEKGAKARKFGSIQKTLEENGYFGFYEQSPENATWGNR